MSWRSLRSSFSDFWSEFRRVKYGVVGLILFGIFIAVIVFAPYIIAFPETGTRWRDITYWEDNPKSAAPVWSNFFSARKKAPQAVLKAVKIATAKKEGSQKQETVFRYRCNYYYPPNDLFLHTTAKGIMNLRLLLKRPDGKTIELLNKVYSLGGETPLRISLSRAAAQQAMDFVTPYETTISSMSQEMMRPTDVFFSKAQQGILEHPVPLKGDYEFKLTATIIGAGSYLKDQRILVAGNMFGLLGTDSSGRDIWSGVIVGTKWAMLIGLLTSAITIIVGILYGVSCAYFAGWVDALGMRIYDVFQSIPILPILIVLSAIFKPSIWILILVMCVFSWVGPVRTVRSISLQIKEETYIEAARALGASGPRIIFRYIIPQLIPYAAASMALSVPAFIGAEATISLIGLGDATIVTWGQILHDAMVTGAILQGIWWWIIPPGLFIAVMGMTFAFVGFAMDTILNPKLRTR